MLADARERGAERHWCLGDVVGYGSQPAECLARIRELDAQMIKGNHEEAVLRGPLGFNPLASQAVRWTRDVLEQEGDALDYISSLGIRIDEREAVLVHGSPAQPIDEYLFREDTLDHLPRGRDFSPKLARCFRLIDRPCFVGHTHVPGVIDEGLIWTEPADVEQRYDTGGRPCIINVGSTGQPRDGDTRASYALFDGRTVEFRRVAYDVEAAARRILEEDGLPDPLGHRLIEGW